MNEYLILAYLAAAALYGGYLLTLRLRERTLNSDHERRSHGGLR